MHHSTAAGRKLAFDGWTRIVGLDGRGMKIGLAEKQPDGRWSCTVLASGSRKLVSNDQNEAIDFCMELGAADILFFDQNGDTNGSLASGRSGS